jgi:biopolymer transport protein ExbB
MTRRLVDRAALAALSMAPIFVASAAWSAPAKVEFVDPIAPSALGQVGMDLSPVGMFESAGGVVQVVIVGLLLASVLTWTVSLAKWVQLRGEQQRLREAVQKLRLAPDFAGIGEMEYPPLAEMIVQAEDEMIASSRAGTSMSPEGVKDRISLRLDQLEADLRLSAGRGIGVLAIVSSTAPFVGLAGTVWGIMNSFIGIAHSHTTNLAVVAPGIAEALLTTAVGLVAAIPAAILYNVFARVLATYAGAISNAGATVLCLAAREVDSVHGRG